VNRQGAKDAKFESSGRDALESGKFPENSTILSCRRFEIPHPSRGISCFWLIDSPGLPAKAAACKLLPEW
jgi:hypothetical protein